MLVVWCCVCDVMNERCKSVLSRLCCSVDVIAFLESVDPAEVRADVHGDVDADVDADVDGWVVDADANASCTAFVICDWRNGHIGRLATLRFGLRVCLSNGKGAPWVAVTHTRTHRTRSRDLLLGFAISE